MKKLIAGLMVSLMVVIGIIGFQAPAYASDWDKAGKVLATLAGIRVLTGGNVDIIGNITGIRQSKKCDRDYSGQTQKHCKIKKNKCYSHYVWVPAMVWKKEYIPEHREYSEKYGTIIVEGHYIKYQVEQGGYWTSKYCDHKDYSYKDKYEKRYKR
ncbi:MAG: hypothetical protein PVI33_06730 [Candidatus Omnitrophota bacterium]|jgi:hypothetical protein